MEPGIEQTAREGGDEPEVPLGADSVAWRVVGDWRIGLVLGRGLLLQVMHPVVGAGVAEHSTYQSDPWGRLNRSLIPIIGAVYDGPAARQTGADIREMHKSIKGVDGQGRRYHAMDPDAYFWVHATIFESVLRTHELFGRQLSVEEQDQFYEEWRQVGRTLGLRDRDMPSNLPGFRAYYARMLADRLENHATAHDVLAQISSKDTPPPPVWPLPAAVWKVLTSPLLGIYQSVTIGSLPVAAREKLGIEWTKRDERRLRRYAAVIRLLGSVIPRRLRYLPRAAAGFRREGKSGG